jgi:hypothetical protein
MDDWKLPFGYFQENEATYHTPEWPLEEIKGFFRKRIILKGLWLHQSSDMTLLASFHGVC